MENMTTEKSEWFSTSDAARELHLSSAMIGVLMNQGKLHFVPTRLGRLIDPLPASVARLKAEREQSHSAGGK